MATGSITKYTAKDGTISYRARADGGLDPASGKRRQLLKTHRTKQEAQTWLREQQRCAATGHWADGGKILLKDWITQWLTGPGARNRRPNTVHTYALLLVRVTAALGHVPLAKLRPVQLEAFLQQQEADLAPATVRAIFTALRTCLGDAERLNMIAENPARRVQPPRKTAGTRPSWTVEHARTFWTVAAADPDAALWLLLLTAALRIGEALTVTWADVDLAAGLLHIRRTLTRTLQGREVAGTTTKSGTSRTIPLAPQMVEALRGQRARVLALQMANRKVWADQDLVFPSPNGTPWGSDRWRVRLAILCTQAEVPRLTPHGLRHTAASILATQAPIAVARDVLGHANVATTNTYVHGSRDQATAATAALAGVLTGS